MFFPPISARTWAWHHHTNDCSAARISQLISRLISYGTIFFSPNKLAVQISTAEQVLNSWNGRRKFLAEAGLFSLGTTVIYMLKYSASSWCREISVHDECSRIWDDVSAERIEDLLKESSLHLELPIPTRVVQYKMKSAAVYFVMSFSFKVFHVTCNLSAKSDYLWQKTLWRAFSFFVFDQPLKGIFKCQVYDQVTKKQTKIIRNRSNFLPCPQYSACLNVPSKAQQY